MNAKEGIQASSALTPKGDAMGLDIAALQPEQASSVRSRKTAPRIYLVGETKVDFATLGSYLRSIGADGWTTKNAATDAAVSDAELMVEAMGRLCYRSWIPGLNPNVTKVRDGNDVYLANILASRHGSVLEHSVTNWIFADVSRVFTHEMVRHRAGTAFSQESLRYVRLESLGFWLPPEVEADPDLVDLFRRTFDGLSELQVKLAAWAGLDSVKNFSVKKRLTSAFRRLAPDGMATTIGVSLNFRALRHLIEMRTDKGAEDEMRLVFDLVARTAKARWPNVFQDFDQNGDSEWVAKNREV